MNRPTTAKAMKTNSKEEFLNKLYSDPGKPGAFSGPEKIKQTAKKDGRYDISRRDVNAFLQNEDTYTTNRPVRHKFQRSKVISYGINDLVDIDLADMSSLSKYNKKYKYLVVSVDTFSRYAKVRPVRQKTASAVLEALESIFSTGPRVRMVRSDLGLEFKNSKVANFFERKGIRHHFATPPIKAGYAERFIQTLKQLIYRYLYHVNSFNYVTALEQLVENYNSRSHKSLGGLAPREVTTQNTATLWNRMYIKELRRGHTQDLQGQSRPKPARKFTLDKGQHVRISYAKNPFRRAYKQTFTDEIFIVTDRYYKDGIPVFKLTDMKHRLIDGIFYAPELQAVSKKEIWKIERILRKKGRQVLVRWKGFGQDFDSWIPKSSVQNIVHKK